MENFNELLQKYADFIVRVGVNPQPGQTMIIRCPLEAAPLARLCVRSGFEAGARDVQVDWSDNAVSRTRMELGSEEALTDFKPYQLRRYLDYAESEGGVCVLHIHADDPEVYAGLDGAKISRVNAAQRRFMAPWREYTMNDRVQWSIAAMPSAPWAKKMFPELEEAAAIAKLIAVYGLSQEQAAERLGKSQSAVANKLRLLRLSPACVALLREGGLSERHARALLRLSDENERLAALRVIVERGCNVAQAEAYIESVLQRAAVTPPRRRPTFIVKDVRLFLNTIRRSMGIMQRAGVDAACEREDTDEEIRLTIRIPRTGAAKTA